MGCGPSNSAVAAVPSDGDGTSNGTKNSYRLFIDLAHFGCLLKWDFHNEPPAPSEAFEIPLDDENPDSLIKKHPPLRLKRLEEHSTTPPSIEDLEGKLATAEIRRQQFLASRVQKTTTIDKTDNEENGDINAIREEDEPEEGDAKEEDVKVVESNEEDVIKVEKEEGVQENTKCDTQEEEHKES